MLTEPYAEHIARTGQEGVSHGYCAFYEGRNAEFARPRREFSCVFGHPPHDIADLAADHRTDFTRTR